MAVSSRQPLEKEGFYEGESAVYHSADGVTWERRILGPDQEGQALFQVACSAEDCVVGGHTSEGTLTYSSSDGKNWLQKVHAQSEGLEALRYVGDQFFVLNQDGGALLTSSNGAEWLRVEVGDPSNKPYLMSIAHGNGRYLLGATAPGATVMGYRSLDGTSWEPLPSMEFCEPEPGMPGSCSLFRLFFAEGQFYGQGIRSSDGESWMEGSLGAPWGRAGTSLLRVARWLDLSTEALRYDGWGVVFDSVVRLGGGRKVGPLCWLDKNQGTESGERLPFGVLWRRC